MGATCHRNIAVVHRRRGGEDAQWSRRWPPDPGERRVVAPVACSGGAGMPEEHKVTGFRTLSSGVNTPWQHPSAERRQARRARARLPFAALQNKSG